MQAPNIELGPTGFGVADGSLRLARDEGTAQPASTPMVCGWTLQTAASSVARRVSLVS